MLGSMLTQQWGPDWGPLGDSQFILIIYKVGGTCELKETMGCTHGQCISMRDVQTGT